jgi:hypothetical protein
MAASPSCILNNASQTYERPILRPPLEAIVSLQESKVILFYAMMRFIHRQSHNNPFCQRCTIVPTHPSQQDALPISASNRRLQAQDALRIATSLRIRAYYATVRAGSNVKGISSARFSTKTKKLEYPGSQIYVRQK